jgi:ATP synthase protein I
MKDIAYAMSLGFTIVGCILVGVIIGYYLDSYLQTKPIFMIIGILLGVVSSFLVLYRMVVNK